MSKLPVSNSRYAHESPPIKNRKAFNDMTDMYNNSPIFSSQRNSVAKESHLSSHKLNLKQKQRTSISGIPTRMQPTYNTETFSKLRIISEASSNFPQLKKDEKKLQKSTVFSYSSLHQDPIALKKQEQLEDQALKNFQADKLKLESLQKEIDLTNEKIEKFSKNKMELVGKNHELKNKIGDTEINLINLDYKYDNLQMSTNKQLAHNRKLKSVELKEQQNQLIKELDEFKALLIQELQKAQTYEDDESIEEITKLEDEKRKLLSSLKSLNDMTIERLSKEKKELETQLEGFINTQESKSEELARTHEIKQQELSKTQAELQSLNHEIKAINDAKLQTQTKIDSYKSILQSNKEIRQDLMSKISDLKLSLAEVDKSLQNKTSSHVNVLSRYNDIHDKVEKEEKLRRRIENSIQELKGHLRVYVKISDVDKVSSVLQYSDDRANNGLTVNHEFFEFDKILSPKVDPSKLSDEITCICESNLNGANVSIVSCGCEDGNFSIELLKSMIKTLQKREPKFKINGWGFDYSLQIVSITENGFIDLLKNNDSCKMNLEDEAIILNSTIMKDLPQDLYESVQTPDNSSTLFKLTVKGSNDENGMATCASTYILDLTKIESFDLIRQSVGKINESKFSSQEFSNSPMYQLVHFLYSNTKTLSLFSIGNYDNIEEVLDLLNLAKFVNSVNVPPTRRVYT